MAFDPSTARDINDDTPVVTEKKSAFDPSTAIDVNQAVDTAGNPREKVGDIESFIRGASNAATLGTGKYIQAPINAGIDRLMGYSDPKKGFWEDVKSRVQPEVDANAYAAQDNPLAYGGGSVVGALPQAMMSLPAQVASAGFTTLTDTQDAGDAATSAGLAAAIPLVGRVASKVAIQTPEAIKAAAKERVAMQVAEMANSGPKRGLVKGGLFTETIVPGTPAVKAVPQKMVPNPAGGPSTVVPAVPAKAKTPAAGVRPNDLATNIRDKGIGELNAPQFERVKQAILGDNPSGFGPLVKDTYREMTGGAVGGGLLGGQFGVPGIGAGIGTVLGLGTGVRQAMVRKEIGRHLPPTEQVPGTFDAVTKPVSEAAKRGADKLREAMPGGQATAPFKFAAVTGALNQTDPEVRASLNPESPLNEKTPDDETQLYGP